MNEKKISARGLLLLHIPLAKKKFKKGGRKCTITSMYNQEKNLQPLFTKEISFLYPSDIQRVKLHTDRATSHILKSTTAFLEKMQTNTGIAYIPF